MPLPDALTPAEMTTDHNTAMAYGELTADFNPIHCDPDFAASSPFGRAISHGTMALNLVLVAAERTFGQEANVTDLRIRFSPPMPVGETLRATGARRPDGAYDVAVELPDGTRALEGVMIVAESGA